MTASRAPGLPSRRELLFVLLFFTALTVAMTWPVTAQMGSFFAKPVEDVAYNTWNLWWGGQALAHFENPLYTHHLFYPEGASLLWREYGTFVNLAVAPVTLAFGAVVAYNLAYLLSFLLAGLGAYLLGRYVTRSHLAGLGAGVAFAFTPSHFIVYPTLAYVHIQWIPFLFWSLLMLKDTGRLRHGAWAGVWLAFCLQWSVMHYGIYAGLATACIGAWYFLVPSERPEDRRRWLLGVGVCLFTAFLLTAFRTIPMALEALKGVETDIPPKNFVDALGLRARLGGERSLRIIGWPAVAGYVTCLGALAACFTEGWKRTRLWILLIAAFYLVALGSKPTFMDKPIPIPMPTDFLRKLPLLGSLRFEGLAMMLVWSWAAVLFAMFLARVESWYRAAAERLSPATGAVRPWAAWGVLALCIGELWPPPHMPHPSDVPEFYRRLAEEDDQGAVLSIPFSPHVAPRALTRPMRLQTIHGKPLISGHVAGRPDPERDRRYTDVPFLALFLDKEREDALQPFAPADPATAAEYREQLRALGVRTVILYRQHILPEGVSHERGEPKNASIRLDELLVPIWYGPLAVDMLHPPDESEEPGFNPLWAGHQRSLHPSVEPFLRSVLGVPEEDLEDGGLVWRIRPID